MYRESRVITGLVQTSLLGFSKFLDPDRHDLLKLGTDQVAERSVFAGTLFQNSVTQSLAQVGELVRLCICAQCDRSLLPVGEIGIVNDIP